MSHISALKDQVTGFSVVNLLLYDLIICVLISVRIVGRSALTSRFFPQNPTRSLRNTYLVIQFRRSRSSLRSQRTWAILLFIKIGWRNPDTWLSLLHILLNKSELLLRTIHVSMTFVVIVAHQLIYLPLHLVDVPAQLLVIVPHDFDVLLIHLDLIL